MKNNRGVTLIEIIIVISIIALMAGLAAPPILSYRKNAIMRSNGNRIVNILQMAKSRAIKSFSRCFIGKRGLGWRRGKKSCKFRKDLRYARNQY